MSQVTYTLVVNIVDPYGGDSPDRILPTPTDTERTVQDVLKAQFEEKIEKVCNIIKGDIQLLFVSLTEA